MYKENRIRYLIIASVSVLFFFLFNIVNFTTPRLFNSPDETTHFVFLIQFAQSNVLTFSQPYDYGQYSSLVFPRSTVASGSTIVPVGFWGLDVLYGLIAKVIGSDAIVFVTSLLTLVAGWCFFWLMKKIFFLRVAFWSTILFFTHPAIWYYSARSLFPNIPFLSLLLIGAYLLFCRPLSRLHFRLGIADDAVGMVSILLALLIRPSEVWWVAVIGLIICGFYRNSFTAARIFLGTIIGVAALAGYVYITNTLFPGELISYTASQSFTVKEWYQFIFPFGLHPKTMALTAWHYGFKLFWWLMIPTIIGLIHWFRSQRTSPIPNHQLVYIIVTASVGLFLLLFYGSFHDPLFSLLSIGVAYTRYFLPIFVFLIPFLVFGFFHISATLGKKFSTIGLAWLMTCIVLLNVRIVFLGPDGLLAVADNIIHGAMVRDWTTHNTSSDALILTDAEDKFFWPARQVLVKSFHPDILVATSGLVSQGYPVYYFAPLPKDDERQDWVFRFTEVGLEAHFVHSFPPHGLYQLLGLKNN